MPMYLGSFTGGLFGGAQSAMQFYQMYQGIQQTQRWLDAGDKVELAKKERDQMIAQNEYAPGGVDPDTGKPRGQDMSSTRVGITQQPAPPPATQQAGGYLPPPSPPGGEGTGDYTGGGFGSAVANRATQGPVSPAVTGAAPSMGGDDTGLTPAPIPTPATTDAYRMVSTSPSAPLAPFNAAGIPGQPGSPSGPTQYPPARDPAPVLAGEPIPYQRPVPPLVTRAIEEGPGLIRRGWEEFNRPGGGPGTLPYGDTAHPPTPQPPAPVPVTRTEPVGGFLGGGSGPSAVQPVRPAPIIPPTQRPAAPSGYDVQQAPALLGEPKPQYGYPGAPAAPSPPKPEASITDKLLGALSHLNPIGSAQAAESYSGKAPGTFVPPEAQPTGDAPAAPAPAGQGITPATPPKAPGASATPPVQVAGAGKVAPGQPANKPSQQSESTPPVYAIPVSPSAYNHLLERDPQMAALVDKITSEPGSTISKYTMAAVVERESKWDPNAKGEAGEEGLGQIMPATRAGLDPRGLLNPWKAEDNLRLVSLLYKENTEKYGQETFATHLAYMRGPRGVAQAQANWDFFKRKEEKAVAGIEGLFDGKISFNDKSFGSGHGGTYHAPDLIRSAQDGPDGVLEHLVAFGPRGMSMSDRWRSAQSALESAAISSGKIDMLPHIQEWISQQSHMGALSNMMAGHQMLLAGNGAGAAQMLARSHAFFPDGTYARFGTDKNGKDVWGEQFSEKTGEAIGPKIHITPDVLAAQMVALQNPATYLQTLQKMQKTAAEIDLHKMQAKYYGELPALKREEMGTKLEVAGAREEGRQATQQQITLRQEDAARHKAEIIAARDENDKALNAEYEKWYGAGGTAEETIDPVTKAKVLPEHLASEGEAFRAFNRPRTQGGAGMGGRQANAVAQGVREGRYTLQPMALGKNPDGTPRTGYAIMQGNQVVNGISKELGDALIGLPGLKGAMPIAKPEASLGVGTGAGSQQALAMGLNQNLGGMPMRPMQPRQPPPQMSGFA